MTKIQLLVIASSLFLLLFVLELVRRRRLREEYSWLWLATAIGYATIAIFPSVTRIISVFLGVERSTSIFIFAGFLFLFLICIQFSVRLSRLSNQNKILAQQVAILDSEMRRLAEINNGEVYDSFESNRPA
jgi:hypothetical protein